VQAEQPNQQSARAAQPQSPPQQVQGYGMAPPQSPYSPGAQPPAMNAGPQAGYGAPAAAGYGAASNSQTNPFAGNNLPPAQASAPQQQMVNNRYASNGYAPQAAPAPQPGMPNVSAPPVAPPAAQAVAPQAPVAQAAAPNQVASQTLIAQYVSADQAPPISLDGFCPVTILEQTKWTKGDPQFGAVHRGRTYLFATAAEQQKFLVDPDRYSPVLSGCDAVQYLERGEMVEGQRKFGVAYRNQLFLFADAASRDRFEKSAANYATGVSQAMLRSETGVIRR
jgi:protein disulfide-isomerase